MCGIAGLIEFFSPCVSDEGFDSFLDSLQHRGPDGRGVYKERGVFLGHRRLKILDLSANGAQPMSDTSGRYWITFNGEIYNFLELKRELGGSFRTESDTEVILEAYKKWGPACQLRFNGMWAFAIWDSHEKTLFMSRDRFGVKPLFLFQNEQIFAFASELKAFLFLPTASVEFDTNAIIASIKNTSFLEPSDYTLFKQVYKLQPGHHAILRQRTCKIERWWNLEDHLEQVDAPFEGQVERFKELFQDACHIRMRSDVPLGCALSGGLDSSSVLSMTSRIAWRSNQERLSPDWQRSFSALYPGTSQDEALFAETMVKAVQAKATFLEIRPEMIVTHLKECLYSVEDIFELPIGPWLLYREFRRQKVPISLDGHGADELLGGYHHHAVENALIHSPLFRFRESRKTIHSLYPANSPAIPTDLFKRACIYRLKRVPGLYQALRRFYPNRNKNRFDWLAEPSVDYLEQAADLEPPACLKDLNRLLFADFHQKTLPAILRNFDRCSMAHGIEVRAPFLDYRVVCYLFSLPPTAKIGQGFTKRILREAMKGILPEGIRTRMTKVGFANPLTEWLKTELKGYVLDSISSRSFLECPLWRGDKIRDAIEEGYKKNEIASVRRAWEYLQAHQLMTLFKEVKS